MNTTKITVRLDAEHRQAELEMMTPHELAPVGRVDQALRRIGIEPLGTVELETPRYRVTKTKLAELDGSLLDATRVMQILRAARCPEPARLCGCCRAA
jgi:hypothetical protein